MPSLGLLGKAQGRAWAGQVEGRCRVLSLVSQVFLSLLCVALVTGTIRKAQHLLKQYSQHGLDGKKGGSNLIPLEGNHPTLPPSPLHPLYVSSLGRAELPAGGLTPRGTGWERQVPAAGRLPRAQGQVPGPWSRLADGSSALPEVSRSPPSLCPVPCVTQKVPFVLGQPFHAQTGWGGPPGPGL